MVDREVLGMNMWKRELGGPLARLTLLAVLAIGGPVLAPAMPALAQEPPAVAAAGTPEEKARITQLIEGARKEGELVYWDTVIQPDVVDQGARPRGRSDAVDGVPVTLEVVDEFVES